MNTWIWTVVALLSVDVLAKLFGLATGIFPKRSAAGTVIDVFIIAALFVWLAAVWK